MSASLYRKTADFVARRIADELILVPISRRVEDVNCLYALNAVGARIWDLIDGQRPIEGVRDALLAEFDVSPSEVEEDLRTVFEQLKDIGAIQPVPSR